MKAFDVGIYIDMYDYHDLTGQGDGFDGMFNIRIKAETPDDAMERVKNDCIESNCPYHCEPHTASEVKEYVYN